MKKNKLLCCICGCDINGYPHSAYPVKSGVCCASCNTTVVLARLHAAKNPKVKIGDKIRILHMEGEPEYTNREGVVLYIDDIGQLHGDWGSLAVIIEVDSFVVL